MHSYIRNFALPLSIFSLAALGACKSDATDNRSAKDVLAQDSTLDLAMMSANGDSVGQASGDTNLGARSATQSSSSAPTVASSRDVAAAPAPAPARSVATTRQPVSAVAAPRRASISNTRSQTRRARRTRLISSTETTPRRVRRTQRATTSPGRTRRGARVLSSTARSNEGNSAVMASAPIERAPVVSAPRERTRATSSVIPTGSSFSLVTQQKICTSSAKVGDTFSASLVKEVVGPSGVVIPAGTSATGEVISTDDSRMRVAIRSIDFDGRSYPVSSNVTFADMQTVKVQPKGGSTSRVLAGAGIGAILGRVIGGNVRSAVIGAAGGAAAGAVVANKSVRYDQCVPDGGQIIAHLAQPLRVQLGD